SDSRRQDVHRSLCARRACFADRVFFAPRQRAPDYPEWRRRQSRVARVLDSQVKLAQLGRVNIRKHLEFINGEKQTTLQRRNLRSVTIARLCLLIAAAAVSGARISARAQLSLPSAAGLSVNHLLIRAACSAR